jgi:uncharacterized membrane protein YgdD (TMEM256/DUF423 family)
MLSVVFGAFAAHGLKPLISTEAMNSFETGVRYQMFHALFLLFLGATNYVSNDRKKFCFYLVLFGLILFSGSIYALATNTLTSFDFKAIALVTPLGGLLLIFAWLILLINSLKMKGDNSKN